MSQPTRRDFLVLSTTALGALLLGASCGDDGGGGAGDTANNANNVGPDGNNLDLNNPDPDPDMSFDPDVDEAMLPDTALDLPELLTRYFEGGDLESVKAVGRAYIQRFSPDEAAVIADLTPTVEVVAELTDLPAALEALDAAALADFEAVEVAAVYGWQFGRTEARLCALVDRLV